MDYNSMLNSIKRGVFSPVYLFHGTEKLLINQVAEKIKNKMLDPEVEAFNFDLIDGEKVSAGRVVDLANIVPVISEKRVVIVNNPPYFLAAKGQEKGDEQALLEYLGRPNPGCCLIFKIIGKADKRKKIYKALESIGQIVEFSNLDKGKLEEWIFTFFKEKGKKIEPKALEYLTVVGSSGLEKLENELEKVYLYCFDSPVVSAKDVEDIVSKIPEVNIFNLLDSIFNKEGKKALELLNVGLSMGEVPMVLIYRLLSHLRIVLVAKDMITQGFSEKQIKDRLGAHPFTVSKAIKQSKKFTMLQLAEGLGELLETEIKIKTGGGNPKELLESLVIKLCYQ